MTLTNDNHARIAEAVDRSFEEQLAMTKELVSIPSTRSAEWPAQDLLAGALRARDYIVDDWRISLDELRGFPDIGVVETDFSRARTVVGTLPLERETGRSLILQGHCDVVPPGPLEMWETAPFVPEERDGWLHGRGAADMKAGTIAALYAVDAIRNSGLKLAGRIHVQSVIEEESTGIGALSALQRGYRADCAVLPEPTGQMFSDICLGVIWFRIRVSGVPTHVSHAGEGFNAMRR